ncbi:M60 family metallopeptidase [Streptomyces lavendulae]|uniref:M60 family metallopeptidase n=1 Tax=Streptomyces lavendulae TaxID=1914 RepID=UPI00381EE3C0
MLSPDGDGNTSWKSIGDLKDDGTFLNPAVPTWYRFNEDTLRIRARNLASGQTSEPIDLTLSPALSEVRALWAQDSMVWLSGWGGPRYARVEALDPAGDWTDIGGVENDNWFGVECVQPSGDSALSLRVRDRVTGRVSPVIEILLEPALTEFRAEENAGRVAASGRGAPAGAQVQAYRRRTDGTWAWDGIGDIKADGSFSNPDTPTDYLFDANTLRVRVGHNGRYSSPVDVSLAPVLTEMRATRTDGRISASGQGSPAGAHVQAYRRRTDGTWAWDSIGDIKADGSFSNPDTPTDYLFDANTLRVRAGHNGRYSSPVDATIGFPQSRVAVLAPQVPARMERSRLQQRQEFADYQPTGFFAPRSAQVSITVEGIPTGTLQAVIGTQGLADRDRPSTEQSPSMRVTELGVGENTVADAFGGIIHIRYTSSNAGGPVRITLGPSTVPIAYYAAGRTSPADWRTMLETSSAPEVEMVSDSVVVTALRQTALGFRYADPAATLADHEKVFAAEFDISGMDGSLPLHERPRLRLYAVESAGNRNPHSAYPGYIGWPHDSWAPMALTSGVLNSWGMWHEYGHHMQQEDTFLDTLEVTVNTYSLAVARRGNRHDYTDELPRRWPGTRAWLARPPQDKSYSDASDPMAMFDQLRRGLGSVFLKNLHKYVRAYAPSAQRDTDSDGTRKHFFLLSACEVAGLDLSDFFTTWGFLKESGTRSAIAGLRLPRPARDISGIEPYVTTEDLVPAPEFRIANPGFNTGSTGWHVWGRGSIDNAVSRTGSRSLRITGTGGGEQWVTGLTPGKRYSLCAWGKVDQAGMRVRIGVKNQPSEVSFVDTGWREMCNVFTAISDGVIIYGYGDGANRGNVDDFTLTEVRGG